MEEFEIALANLDKNMFIEASAGTGKTYSLEHLVIRYILEKGYDISEILVVTFTKKAAFELENRIRALLKNKVAEIATAHNKIYLKRLKEAFSRFAESQIYTIHGFCQYCIHNFPFESGVSFRTSVMNSQDIYKEAVLDYLRTAGSNELSDFYLSFRKKYKNFSDIIELFVSMIENRFAIDGNEIIPDQEFIDNTEKYCSDFLDSKGRLYNAIEQLSKCNYSPSVMEEISKKMKLRFQSKTFEKLSHLLGSIVKAQTVGEVFSDAFIEDAGRLKKYSYNYLSENKDISILSPDELFLVKNISAIFDALKIFADNETDEDSNKYVFHNIASYIFIKNAAQKIIQFAEQKKKNAAMFDFNDLVELTRNCVTIDSGNSALANELRRKYKVVLIDEFQDTDISQWEIFSTVFRGKQHKIVLIGDPKQSIYRFRGGDLEVYFKAINTLSNASGYRLATCYRSADKIVKGVNDIFNKIFSHSSGGGHKITYSDVKSCDNNPKLQTENKLPESIIELVAIENECDEKSKANVETIIQNIYADEIIELLNQGVSPSSIAILMEANSICISMLEQLKKLGIPAMYEGDLNIFDSCEAFQFVDLLYALSYPNDMAIVRKSLFSEFFALPTGDIIEIENSFNMDRIAEIFACWSGKTARGKFYEVIDEIFYKDNPVAGLVCKKPDIRRPYVSRTLEELGGNRKVANALQISEMLIVRNMGEKEDAASLLRYMISAIKGYEHIEEKSMRLENEPDCVKIMTIHGSKGREFPVVFFSGGLGSSKPLPNREDYYEFIEGGKRYVDFSKNSQNREKQFFELWEEKKRLYYVAMTRASKKLYIPIVKNSPGTDLVSFYASFVSDKLSQEFAENGMSLSIPVNTQKITLPKNMKVSEYNTILSNRIFELVQEFCNDKDYFKFRKIKSSDFYNNSRENICLIYAGNERQERQGVKNSAIYADGEENIKQHNEENLILQQLSCPSPSYKKDDVEKGFFVYSYSMLARNEGHVAAYDTEIRNLEIPEKEPGPEDNLDTGDNIGIKGADFGNIMHKALETASYLKILQYENIDSASEDDEILDFAETCARGFVNSDLAYKSRIPVVKLLYKTLTTPINVNGTFIRIGDIPVSDRKHELDFMFKIKEGNFNFFRERNSFILEDGFLKGFIDMIFRFNEYYYIVDWKTNFLGHSINDYGQASLENAMVSNNYKLQMQLYTIALDMIIAAENSSQKSESETKTKIGGCYYLFLRGLPGAKGNIIDSGVKNFCPGVYFSPPDYETINKFKKTFLE